MKLLPPDDLLEKVSGVEEGLKDNRKIKRFGTFGLLFSAAQLAVAAASSLDGDLLKGRWEWLGRRPVVGLGVFAFAVSFLLVARTRLWLRESSTPFGYNCALVQFSALGKNAQRYFSEIPVWMRYDLAEMLNARVGRLSFLDDLGAGTPAASASTELIRVSGDFLVRRRADTSWVFEVTPRVQIGGGDAAATLGHPVQFVCATGPGMTTSADRADEHQKGAGSRLETSGAPPPTGQDEEEPRPTLPEADYEKIVERVYFSVATQIYRQIRSDVQRKIALLPTKFLRANAYLHEAEDYATSNTLDALDAARDLYQAAMELFDPLLRPVPTPRLRRPYLTFVQWRTRRSRPLRLLAARFWPRLARNQVLTARAEIGYANTLLYRRTLAGLSGHRMNAVYEARPVAQRAVERLGKVPLDVPGCREARFDAQVTLALACLQLDLSRAAEASLATARSILPGRYDEDPRYLYVAGMLEPRARFAIRLHRQAVERDPRLEVAQFELALRSEMMWRTRPTLERSVGDMVLKEYQQVLKINPGNLRAWENIAYVRWLLGDLDESVEAYRRGLEFKQMKPSAVVSGLEYGLARVTAERGDASKGDLDSAYRYYLSASSAQLLRGVSDAKWTSAQFYFFDFIGDAMMERYDRYLEHVEAYLSRAVEYDERIRAIVRSFVLNDHAEACHTYHIRNCSDRALEQAHREYGEAKTLNPDALLPHYNLYLLRRYQEDEEGAIQELAALQRLEPSWPDGILAQFAAYAEAASEEALAPITGGDGAPQDVAESVRRKAEEVTSGDAPDRLRALLPHEWLWRSDGEGARFDWRAVDRYRRARSLQWERELNDLHVRALFLWIVAHLLRDDDGRTRRPDVRIRLPHLRPRRRRDAEAGAFLACIREHFWPGDFSVLLETCRQDPESPARKDVQETIRRWLDTDPTAYWALDLATTDFRDARGGKLALVDDDTRRSFLLEAREVLPDESDLRGWVDERLRVVEQRLAKAA